MRRFLSALLVITMIASLGVTAISASETDGTGTPAISAPAEGSVAITTAEQFAAMEPNGKYHLANDITISVPYDKVFTGTFDGQGKTVTNTCPLFIITEGATVKNIVTGDKNVTVVPYEKFTNEETQRTDFIMNPEPKVNEETGATITPTVRFGAISSESFDSTFENITVNAKQLVRSIVQDPVSGEMVTSCDIKDGVGGVVGYAYGNMTFVNCTNNAKLGMLLSGQAGGICGAINMDEGDEVLFENCVNNAEIAPKTTQDGATVFTASRAAGICGSIGTDDNYKGYITINNCVNNGLITGKDQCGGITGWARLQGEANNCVNNGFVESTGNYCGGIMGRNGNNTVRVTDKFVSTNCVNNGEVIASKSQVGGIVGYANNSNVFYSCTNTGKLHNGSYGVKLVAGGIMGNCNISASFYDCVNTGEVLGNVDGQAGAICGYIGSGSGSGYAVFERCYAGGTVYSEGQTGGLCGYVYGGDNYMMSPYAKYNIVTAVMSASSSTKAGALFGYFNSSRVVATYNIVATDIKATDNGLFWNNKCASDELQGNYIPKTTNLDMVVNQSAEANNDKVRNEVPLDGYKWLYEDVVSGVAAINAELGAEVFAVGADGNWAFGGEIVIPEEATIVATAEDFLKMNPYGNYKLAADITLTESFAVPFCGKFDGANFTITTSVAAFDTLQDAEISNLKFAGEITADFSALEAVDFNNWNFIGAKTDWMGALARRAANIVVTNVSNAANVTGLYMVGGLVGNALDSTFVDCSNSGAIKSVFTAGGIVGGASHDVTIIGCSNSGEIRNLTEKIAIAGGLGGIIGYATFSDVVIEDCSNKGEVYGHKTFRAGGILGQIQYENGTTLVMDGCSNTAKITGGDQVGGLVGWANSNDVVISNSYNSGVVTSNGNYAGGIAGRLGMNTSTPLLNVLLVGNTNDGAVFGHRQYAGGMVGYVANTVDAYYCVNNGDITISFIDMPKGECGGACTADHTAEVGGIIATATSSDVIYGCVNTGALTGNVTAGGIVARLTGTPQITNCLNTGTVTNTGLRTTVGSGRATGGIIGTVLNGGNRKGEALVVAYCGSVGKVTGEKNNVSGLVGDTQDVVAIEIKNNYVLAEVVAGAEATATLVLSQKAEVVTVVTGQDPETGADITAKAPAPLTMTANYFATGATLPAVLAGETATALPADALFIDPAKAASPEFVMTLNELAGETQFWMDLEVEGAYPGPASSEAAEACLTVTKDASGAFVNAHKKVSINTEATCTEAGVQGRELCELCGKVYAEGTVVSAKGHTEVDVPAKAATCAETGFEAGGKQCSVCNEYTVAPVIIPKLPHTEVVSPAVDPTCEADGVAEGKVCSVCNEVLQAGDVIPKLECGKEVELIPAKDPTATEPGNKAGTKCKYCGKVIVAPVEIPALGGGEEETTTGGDETTKAPETPAGTTEAPKAEESGCASAIGASIAVLAVALLAPAGVMLKKKED